jgi:hypothetical protein
MAQQRAVEPLMNKWMDCHYETSDQLTNNAVIILLCFERSAGDVYSFVLQTW